METLPVVKEVKVHANEMQEQREGGRGVGGFRR